MRRRGSVLDGRGPGQEQETRWERSVPLSNHIQNLFLMWRSLNRNLICRHFWVIIFLRCQSRLQSGFSDVFRLARAWAVWLWKLPVTATHHSYDCIKPKSQNYIPARHYVVKTHLFKQTLAGHIMFQLTLLSILLLTDHLMEPIKIYHLKWDQLKSYEEAKNYLGRAEWRGEL